MTGTSAPQATLWSEAELELGEGPRWVDGRLVLVDILAGTLLDADGGKPSDLRPLIRIPAPLGAVAPVASAAGHWIAAAGAGIALLTPSGEVNWLAEPAAEGPVPRRMNDGSCDPAGRFWAGCMAWQATAGHGALFRVDRDGSVSQVLDGLTVPNGPAFSHDGSQMYLADSARGVVHRYPVDVASGDLGPAEPFVRLDHGSPDGMAVDVDGYVWIAVWGGGEVRRYAPDGVLDVTVTVPAPQPTAPCLGGPDGRRLFVTTARYGLEPDAVGLSGSVFAVDVGTPGPPASAFGGSGLVR
ncbi:MAG: SMP-30/gluconolactonase/LRE family protein [Micromonosporaceae bacterium]